MGKILKRQNFNDTLAILFGAGIPALWVLSHWYPLPPEAVGASIAVWTLVAQHYFRKAAPSNGTPP